MNNAQEVFSIWAPPTSIWSRWAKPVLFAEMDFNIRPSGEVIWPRVDIQNEQGTAVIVDLPGEESVRAGIGLAKDGFRPVPLFNSASGSGFDRMALTTVSVSGMQEMLLPGALKLLELQLQHDAPPAFLLDANRAGTSLPTPGKFDNRSVVFPQDFPSANFLLSHGISRILLYQTAGRFMPREDLAHVLLRWQEAKIELFGFDPARPGVVTPMRVSPPSHFKQLWQRAVAMIGLRRSSAGGFGSIVPEPSQSGHG